MLGTAALTSELTARVRVVVIAAAIVLAATHTAAYLVGVANGKTSAAKADVAAVERRHQQDIQRIGKDIARGHDTAKAVEASAQKTDRYFNRLNQDARTDAHASIDDFELPADRLRRWRAANAGPFAGASAPESDGTARPAPSAGERQAERPGGEPP